ncbi:eukaryotic translation elongation factor 1 epsilon-1-like [Asterias rubens]|uniref:eukaryotic translation elongation factor 1 epsilon-1-like n=1 Tax=Asterias rubens TaxID=7604 RepID=UPI00145546D1|nr:eukaryotic translation elongation factor 1 epsilon-1-like [Asterias rubens]
MADIKQDLKTLSKYLDVTGIKINVNCETKAPTLSLNGTTVTGLSSIATYLAKTAGRRDLIGGNDAVERALIAQWLEYRVTEIDRCHGEKDISTVLKELNTYLATRTYFVGDHFTLPDMLLAYGLHSTISGLTHQEKEKFGHLSRWFDNIQSLEGVLKHQPRAYFIKNLIYAGVQC